MKRPTTDCKKKNLYILYQIKDLFPTCKEFLRLNKQKKIDKRFINSGRYTDDKSAF
jgi:hypothetical protein